MSQYVDNTKPKSAFISNIIIATGSAFAGYASDVLCYPLDTINTWIKLSTPKDSIRQIVRDHIRKEGFKVFFNGVNAQFMHSFVPNFVYFFCYETFNKYSRIFLDKFSLQQVVPLIPSFSAAFSQCSSLLILVPIDALKTRMQANKPDYRYSSVLHGLTDIIKKEGYFRLFQASPVYIFHAIVFNMILFQAYESLRIRMMARKGKTNKELTLLDSLQNTALATMLAMSITNPLDLIIIRYQVTDSTKAKLSFRKIVKDVLKRDGLLGLNRGVFFRTFYGSVSACLTLPFYEELRKRYGYDFAEAGG